MAYESDNVKLVIDATKIPRTEVAELIATIHKIQSELKTRGQELVIRKSRQKRLVRSRI